MYFEQLVPKVAIEPARDQKWISCSMTDALQKQHKRLVNSESTRFNG